jgi:hypothetical protein
MYRPSNTSSRPKQRYRKQLNKAYCGTAKCSTGCIISIKESFQMETVQKLYDLCQPTDFESRFILKQMNEIKASTQELCKVNLDLPVITVDLLKQGSITNNVEVVELEEEVQGYLKSEKSATNATNSLKMSALFIAFVGLIMSNAT